LIKNTRYLSVHGSIRDHNEELKIKDEIRTIFAQYMNQKGKSKSKYGEGSNKIREHHRNLIPKEKKGCIIVITIIIPINHPLDIIIDLEVILILQSKVYLPSFYRNKSIVEYLDWEMKL